jgi:superfamily II DNA or RNA helicase
MRLRSYQQEAVETCLGWHNKGTKSLCLVMPTGGGKTVTASRLALEIAQLRDGPVLWLAHRRELIKQAVKSLRKYGVQPSIIAPWATRDLSARVQVGSIQTVRLLDELPDAAVVVWDECHHAEGEKWSSIAKAYAYRKAFLVGLTATPERADGKGLHPTFRRLVIAAKTSRLMREGYLVPCEVMVPPRLITDGVADIPVALWEQYAPDTRTVVFCSNVEHAKATAQEFVARGYRAAWIEGDMSSRDRERVLRAFETGRIQILTNCQILTEGFDLPSIETVLLARSVGSHALYLQMVGRGLRPEQGKSKMTLLDATGCTRLYGHPNLDRKYSLKGKPIELEDSSKIATRTCPSCGTILQERGGQCPRCGLSISAQRPRKKVYNDRLEKMSTRQVVEFEKWFYDRALDRAMRQDLVTAQAVARDKFFRRFGKMPEVQKWTSR